MPSNNLLQGFQQNSTIKHKKIMKHNICETANCNIKTAEIVIKFTKQNGIKLHVNNVWLYECTYVTGLSDNYSTISDNIGILIWGE